MLPVAALRSPKVLYLVEPLLGSDSETKQALTSSSSPTIDELLETFFYLVRAEMLQWR
jgi:hypothetical protein